MFVGLAMGLMPITLGRLLGSKNPHAELAPKSAVSISIGFTNTLTMCTAPIIQPLIGYIFNWLTPDIHLGIIETYSLHNFRVALSILPILFFVAIFFSFKIRPR